MSLSKSAAKEEETQEDASKDALEIQTFVPLANLLETGDFADLAVYVGPRKLRFNLHKAVICQNSGYFRTMLKSDKFIESRKSEVHLPEQDPASFLFLIYWLYHGVVKPAPLPNSNTWTLLVLADMWRDAIYFAVPALKSEAMNLLVNMLRNRRQWENSYCPGKESEGPFITGICHILECYGTEKQFVEQVLLILHQKGYLPQISTAEESKEALLSDPELMLRIIQIQATGAI